jgi:hypothetical protein
MWREPGINAVIAVTSAIWVIAVIWLIGDVLRPGLEGL